MKVCVLGAWVFSKLSEGQHVVFEFPRYEIEVALDLRQTQSCPQTRNV